MKTNIFSKVAVTMMTVALGAGIVGSISGTVAWFQYSTRSTVAYSGASAHCTENLQIRVVRDGQAAHEGWEADLRLSEIAGLLSPVTVTKEGTPALGLTTNEATVRSKLSAGSHVFAYDGTNWKLDGGDTAVDPATYGITVAAAPAPDATSKINVSWNDGTLLSPVSSGELAEGDFPSSLYKNPIYQYASTSSWGAAGTSDYVDIPLQFRVLDVDGNTESEKPTLLAKKIYLSDLTIVAATNNGSKKDISDAVRVALSNAADAHNATYSKSGSVTVSAFDASAFNNKVNKALGTYTFTCVNETTALVWKLGESTVDLADYGLTVTGAAADDTIVVKTTVAGRTYATKAASTDVYGSLDLNNDGEPDKDGDYEWAAGNEITYGDNGKTAASIATIDSTSGDKIYDADGTTLKLADDSNPYSIKGKELGSTVAVAAGTAASSWLSINLRIYLEGWQQLESSAIWSDTDYVNSKFNVGLRFTAEAHTDH